MFLRSKIGFYAGEIREFPADVGKRLLELGQAENPYEEPATSMPVKPEQQVSRRRGRKVAQ